MRFYTKMVNSLTFKFLFLMMPICSSRVFKWLVAFVGVCICVYFAGVVLCDAPVARCVDDRTRLVVPLNGSSVYKFTEGVAKSEFGEHGFNKLHDSKSLDGGVIFLHGDSFVEALQVEDAKKPDIVLEKALGSGTAVIGLGRSGTGLPTFIVHAEEYEKNFRIPKCHIFIVTSVIEDSLFDNGDEYQLTPKGLSCRIGAVSDRLLSVSRFINRFHLNILIACYARIGDVRNKKWRFWPAPKRSRTDTADVIGKDYFAERLELLFAEMEANVKAPVVIAYCPNVPRLEKGEIRFDDLDWEYVQLFRRACEKHGVAFVDMTNVLKGLFESNGTFPRGFANSNRFGEGHFNVNGIEKVFSDIADYVGGWDYDIQFP